MIYIISNTNSIKEINTIQSNDIVISIAGLNEESINNLNSLPCKVYAIESTKQALKNYNVAHAKEKFKISENITMLTTGYVHKIGAYTFFVYGYVPDEDNNVSNRSIYRISNANGCVDYVLSVFLPYQYAQINNSNTYLMSHLLAGCRLKTTAWITPFNKDEKFTGDKNIEYVKLCNEVYTII